MKLKEKIAEALLDMGITSFCTLDYRHLRENKPRLVRKDGFEPRSAVIYIIPYFAGFTKNLSIYAASTDYHAVIKEISERLIGIIESSGYRAFGFGDHSPIDERSAALIGGLGIIGDNGLIINKEYGYFVFIGDVITDIPAEELECDEPKAVERCEGCGRCKAACPTGILRGEGSDCLSAITQRKGELSRDEISLMRKYNTVWGCDICSLACPHNKEPKLTPIQHFYKDRIELLTKEVLDNMTDEEFKSRAFSWRGRGVLERNIELLYFEKKPR